MSETDRYVFRRVTPSDFGLLTEWLSRPHVQKWWDTVETYPERKLADPRVRLWIVSITERPFAFIQDYTVHGWKDHHFYELPSGARGIDQYIGEPHLTGKGHGPAFISQHVKMLFDEGAPVVATDPHPENARAISAYRKAGFREFGPPQETRWGLICPMMMSAKHSK